MKCILYFLLAALVFAHIAAAERPNILLIVSDDHGYADVGFNGCRDIPTPHLDALAKSGVICTSGYVSHPFCSPTRAGLLTGRHQQRFGHVFNPVYDPLDPAEGLPLTEKLLPAHLRDAGYTTGWVGKWHLGASPAHIPSARGFAETFGFIGGGHRFFGWKPNERQYTLPIMRNDAPADVPEHLTTRFGTEAAAFVERHTDSPWFLYLAFNSPHSPNEPTPERLTKFSAIEKPKRRKYAAQISLMDDAIGAVIAALDASGQMEQTLIFFFSDNGGPITQGSPNGSENAPLRGGKGDLYEGGVHVPFVVSWPGKIAPGSTFDAPVSSLDVFATALAAAGAEMPSDKTYDSVDLLPHFAGENKAPPHEHLFWRIGTGKSRAVREGQWKLVQAKGQPAALFDLDSDIGESTDLAAARPEVASRLLATLDAWENELPPPAFPGSSVKNEDWGPGGANQRNQKPKKSGNP